MTSYLRMIALFLVLLLTQQLRAAGLISSSQMLFPIQDNRWQLVRFTLPAPARSEHATLTFSDSRGGPQIIYDLDLTESKTLTLLTALPLVSADELQDIWPIQVKMQTASGTFSETINVPIIREIHPEYHLLVQQEALVETGSLRSVSTRPVRMAEFSTGELPSVIAADGILLSRANLRQDSDVPTIPLASGVDIWAQGTTPPSDTNSTLHWQRVADASQNPELTLWRLASPVNPISPINPEITKLPFERPMVPHSIRQVALWLPMVGLILIPAIWLLTRRAWIVVLILAILLPGGAVATRIVLQHDLHPNPMMFKFATGQSHSRIYSQNYYLSSSELLTEHLSIKPMGDLPALPIATSAQQWLAMNDIQIPGQIGDATKTEIRLPSRNLIICHTRQIHLPAQATEIDGSLFKNGMFEKTGQSWDAWLSQQPTEQQNSWRAWWLLSHRPGQIYQISTGDFPLVWQADESP